MSNPQTVETPGSMAVVQRFARTTPGVIGVLAVLLAVSCVIAGVVTAAALDSRIAEHNAVLDRSEPFAHSAQNLYAALSAADAASASAFLAGAETSEVRQTYLQAIADAAAALADATASATDDATRTSVAQITAQLTTYTGLVEAARANSRQGFPIGAAYLREASTLMETSLLPGAEQIYQDDLAEVDRGQDAVGSLPLVALVLLAVVLVAIVFASVLVSRRTNRTVNVGLVVAALLTLVTIGWVVVATQLADRAIENSRTEGSARFEQLAEARILAQQARTEETLQLITRGNVTDSEKEFLLLLEEINNLVGAEPSAATDSLQNWTASHRTQVEVYQGGDYEAAVAQAVGPGADASAAQFSAVESALRDEIEQARTTLRDGVSTAGSRLAWSPTATLILMVIAAVSAVVGLWPRLKEFL